MWRFPGGALSGKAPDAAAATFLRPLAKGSGRRDAALFPSWYQDHTRPGSRNLSWYGPSDFVMLTIEFLVNTSYNPQTQNGSHFFRLTIGTKVLGVLAAAEVGAALTVSSARPHETQLMRYAVRNT